MLTYQWQSHLEALKSIGRGRKLGTEEGIRLDYGSNDYLGLSQHPNLIRGAQAYLENWGTGSQSARLIRGNLKIHEDLESYLSSFFGHPASLLFSSGFQANTGILSAILAKVPGVSSKPAIVFIDKMCHASLFRGCQTSDCQWIPYRHLDMEHFQKCLRRYAKSNQPVVCVTESIFGMDGDQTPLDEWIAIAKEYNAFLMVDEAHAMGLYGPQGKGLCYDFRQKVDVVVGTFGKAFGSFGAFCLCSEILREWLIHTCREWMFTTALPPAVLGAVNAALDLMPALDNERDRVFKGGEIWQQFMTNHKIGCSRPTHIQSIVLGDEKTCLDIHNKLIAQGVFIPAIRPPTVPKKTARLRVSLHAKQTTNDHLWTQGILKQWIKTLF